MADIIKLEKSDLELTAEQLRTIVFDTKDPLGTPEDAHQAQIAYARLEILADLINVQKKVLAKRLANAATIHKDDSWITEAPFRGLDERGHIVEKTIQVTIGESTKTADEILADTLRADLGVSDVIEDDVTDTIKFHVPKAARALFKKLKVLPINESAVKREIRLGKLDGKYLQTRTTPVYGTTTTITTVKEVN